MDIINQFTVRDRQPDTSLTAVEFGREAAEAMSSLNNPQREDLLTAPQGGLLMAPPGATESERTQAAVGFGVGLVGTEGKDVTDKEGWDYMYTQGALLPLLTDPADARRLREAREERTPEGAARARTISGEIDAKVNQLVDAIASLDGDAGTLSPTEVAFFAVGVDRNKDGMIGNDEARSVPSGNSFPSGGTVVSMKPTRSDGG